MIPNDWALEPLGQTSSWCQEKSCVWKTFDSFVGKREQGNNLLILNFELTLLA